MNSAGYSNEPTWQKGVMPAVILAQSHMGTFHHLALMIDPPKKEEYVIPRTEDPSYSFDDLEKYYEECNKSWNLSPGAFFFLAKLSVRRKKLDFADFYISILENLKGLNDELSKKIRILRALLTKLYENQQYEETSIVAKMILGICQKSAETVARRESDIIMMQKRANEGRSPLAESHVAVYSDSSNLNKRIECEICQTKKDPKEKREADVIFYPCRHRLFCEPCYRVIYHEEEENGDDKICYLCEEPILTCVSKHMLDM